MKLDKIYYEFFTLAILKDYDPIRFRHIVHSDAPDLRVKNEIGIEVTQLGTEQEFRYLSIMNRINNNEPISQFDIDIMHNCGYEMKDGMLLPMYTVDESNVYDTIKEKIEKLNNGNYNGFKCYGLFMYMSDTLEKIGINDIISFFKKQSLHRRNYDEVFICHSAFVYIYNFKRQSMDIIDISEKIKKYRNYAINKQRDYEDKRRKPVRRYIADPHYYHANINQRLDKRGFNSTEDMNEFMIKQWNSVTRKNDETIIIGDLSFGDGKQTNEILKRLNGKKFLITGNHDRRFLKDKNFDMNLLEWIKPYEELYDNNRRVILSHYPHLFYNGQYRKTADGFPQTYMLFGHIHDTQDNALLHEIIKFAKTYTFTSDTHPEGSTIPFNLINCFSMFSNYVPLTLDEWIDIGLIK